MLKNINTSTSIRIFTLGVFIICLAIGFWLAARKPLWNDEIYTQTNSIEKFSYKGIILMKFEEGNISPLFYLTQKFICDLFQYRFPIIWKGEWYIADLKSQIIMRVGPNIFMSLAITLIFYYFFKNGSLLLGLYSLVGSLSTFMVLAYWVEARPYALWFFLTTWQLLIFMSILKQRESQDMLWKTFVVVNILLAFTVVFSAWQTAVLSGLLWAYKEKNN